jgi:hypothetical protein
MGTEYKKRKEQNFKREYLILNDQKTTHKLSIFLRFDLLIEGYYIKISKTVSA